MMVEDAGSVLMVSDDGGPSKAFPYHTGSCLVVVGQRGSATDAVDVPVGALAQVIAKHNIDAVVP